jgi:hypothetical protein
MKLNKKVLMSLVISVLAISLSACGGNPAAESTVDPNVIKTEAVETAFAQMTLEAIMNPSVTPTFTETPAPTNTVAPTTTPAVQSTLPGVSSQSGVGATQSSGVNATSATGDKGEWVSNTPEDDFKFYLITDTKAFRNGGVDLTWIIKNTGTTTWNPTYTARYYSGTKIVSPDAVNLKEDSVPPEGTASISVDVKCPDAAGTYYTTWVLSTPDGKNIATFTFQIIVIDGSGTEKRDVNAS